MTSHRPAGMALRAHIISLALLALSCALFFVTYKQKNISLAGPLKEDSTNFEFPSPFTGATIRSTHRLPGFRAPCFFLGNDTVKCLPSFSVAGMPKSGTSALWWYLSHHPHILPQKKLEKCATPGKLTEYFSAQPNVATVCPDCIVGDQCIGLGSSKFISAIYRTMVPTINIYFLLLRQPLEMLYASYWFWCTSDERIMGIPGCQPGRASWNPRKNVTYIVDGVEKWHAFHRSPEDFHARLQGSVADDYSRYRGFVTNMHSLLGEKLRVILSDDLYDSTKEVLDSICKTLGLQVYDFSEIAKFGVNVNGKPGAGSAMIKSRGDYPPLLYASRLLSEPLTRQLCKELEGMLHIPFCNVWVHPSQN